MYFVLKLLIRKIVDKERKKQIKKLQYLPLFPDSLISFILLFILKDLRASSMTKFNPEK